VQNTEMGQVFPFHWMLKSAKAFGFRGATALAMYLSRPTFHFVPTPMHTRDMTTCSVVFSTLGLDALSN